MSISLNAFEESMFLRKDTRESFNFFVEVVKPVVYAIIVDKAINGLPAIFSLELLFIERQKGCKVLHFKFASAVYPYVYFSTEVNLRVLIGCILTSTTVKCDEIFPFKIFTVVYFEPTNFCRFFLINRIGSIIMT